ncbi:MAG: flagellar biosynthetic protein FliR [Pseudomonadota bacterium]
MLQDFLQTNVFLFMLLFLRVGTAIIVMPGIGDGFVPNRIRLFFALGFTLVILPPLTPLLPAKMPGPGLFLTLLVTEGLIGYFIGMIGRILAMALDTAGMLISIQSGLSNAQLFNPSLQSQGSIIGVFLVLSGILMMFVTNMHHMLLAGVFNSYQSFPVGAILDTEGMLQTILQVIAMSFEIGFHIAAPFLLVITVIYIGMGVLNKVMPQMQVFMIALPLQILLSLIMLAGVMGAGLMYWIGHLQDGADIYYQVGIEGRAR